MCAGCGKSKTLKTSPADGVPGLVRMEYVGINVGPIPYKVPSGRVYRGATETYRFVDVFPEDVEFLVGTRKFVKLAQEKPTETEKPEPVSAPLDVSSVKSLRKSLESGHKKSVLVDALTTETVKEKPRATVVKLLEKSIENAAGSPGDL